MARFLLIHGACHGAWCWHRLVPALQALGHEAQALDLPSHGDDPTPLAEVTLDRYAEAILQAAGPDTVVVGHSMAGYPISLAAERTPDRIGHLVYLCAYIPAPGKTLGEMRFLSKDQPLLPAIRRSGDGQSFTFDPAMAREIFYHDCEDADVALALRRMCPQPMVASTTPVALGARYASVPRDYVICEADGAVPPDAQEIMAAELPSGRVHRLPASHSPFFSMPGRLAALLSTIAERA